MKEKTACVILAAGEGKRMRSHLPKVLHPVCGEPMVFYPVELALRCRFRPVIVVVSPEGEPVREALRQRFGDKVKFAVQPKQLGTAHAVLAAQNQLAGFVGKIAILYGDVPLLDSEDIAAARKAAKKYPLVFLTCRPQDPAGYGRVVRAGDGRLLKIVEHRDASAAERAIGEVNTGIYFSESRLLFELLKKVKRKNRQGEYYLTDIVELGIGRGIAVQAVERPGADRILGINDRVQLARAEKEMNRRLAEKAMRTGATIVDPDATWLNPAVHLGRDTVVYPGCHFIGQVTCAEGCRIGPGAVLENCRLQEGAQILAYSVLSDCRVGAGARVGPFARLRPGAVLGRNVHVGNFVEVKNSTLAEGAKANHLTYLGDADVGAGSNIGAGTITCNYDGKNKHRTVIEAGAFIGSDTQLVAPVRVGKGAYVGAGTTVTRDVPPQALAVSRTPQKNIPGYARRRKR